MFLLPCDTAIFLPSKLTEARAFWSPVKVTRASPPPLADIW